MTKKGTEVNWPGGAQGICIGAVATRILALGLGRLFDFAWRVSDGSLIRVAKWGSKSLSAFEPF